jgi:hypothetical protein
MDTFFSAVPRKKRAAVEASGPFPDFSVATETDSHVDARNGRVALILSAVDIRGNVSRHGEQCFPPVAVRE